MKKLFLLLGSSLFFLVCLELILRISIPLTKVPQSTLRTLACYEDHRFKKHKSWYFIQEAFFSIIPNSFWRNSLESKFKSLDVYDQKYVNGRVDYYCKLNAYTALSKNSETIDDFHRKMTWSYYAIDLWEHLKYFPLSNRFAFLPGDTTHIPDQPTIVKSRPIGDHNTHAVLMKFNKIRHFIFTNDPQAFIEKKNHPSFGKIF